MKTPPGVSSKDFNDALTEFSQLTGKQWVHDDETTINNYADPYSLFHGDEKLLPGAVVKPANVEQLQGVLKIANNYGLPLWTVSVGRNFGYGGAAPRLSGSIVVDLSRMNRILEVNEKEAYALVEPGVTFFDLFQYLQKHKIRLWASVPAPGWGSVIGNSLEHGLGYTPFGDHFASQCGMEVVLPDGDILRTGMGALPGNNSWQIYKYGYGPHIDGLFSQSNFGIVSKMGLWLMPEPAAYSSCMVSVPEEDDLGEFVEILRPLRNSNIISNFATFHNILLEIALSKNKGDFEEARKSLSNDAIKKIAVKHGSGWWNMRLAFYGPKKANEANWEVVREAYSKIPGVILKANHFDTPLNPDQSAMNYSDKIQAGLPNMEGFAAMSWRNPGQGHVDLFPVCPLTGEDAMKQYTMIRDKLREYGIDYMSTFIVGPRCMLHGVPLHISQDAESKTRVREIFSTLVKMMADADYGEYRAHLAFMDMIADTYSYNDKALMRFNQRIKDALDPNGILAPGKQGIWPANMRS